MQRRAKEKREGGRCDHPHIYTHTSDLQAQNPEVEGSTLIMRYRTRASLSLSLSLSLSVLSRVKLNGEAEGVLGALALDTTPPTPFSFH